MRSVFRSVIGVNKPNPESALVKPGVVLYICADHIQTCELIPRFVQKNEFKMLTETRNSSTISDVMSM